MFETVDLTMQPAGQRERMAALEMCEVFEPIALNTQTPRTRATVRALGMGLNERACVLNIGEPGIA